MNTLEELQAMTNDQLDEIYFNLVGYRPIKDDGLSRDELIEMILDDSFKSDNK